MSERNKSSSESYRTEGGLAFSLSIWWRNKGAAGSKRKFMQQFTEATQRLGCSCKVTPLRRTLNVVWVELLSWSYMDYLQATSVLCWAQSACPNQLVQSRALGCNASSGTDAWLSGISILCLQICKTCSTRSCLCQLQEEIGWQLYWKRIINSCMTGGSTCELTCLLKVYWIQNVVFSDSSAGLADTLLAAGIW